MNKTIRVDAEFKSLIPPLTPEEFDGLEKKTNNHSEKPEQFRKIIDILYPKAKKIELFARKKIKGWTTWGNELS